MTTIDPLPPDPATSTGRSNRSVAIAVVVVVLVLAAAFIGFVVWSVERSKAPSFPSVADQPDPAVTGTAVYDDYGCLRAVALTGGAPVEVACPGDGEVLQVSWARWTEDDHLEVVIADGDGYRRLEYAFTDGAFAEISDEALDEAPHAPAPTGPDATAAEVVQDDGTVRVVVTGPEGERTVLDVGADDTYGIGDPLWVPDGGALVAHDAADRLLLITVEGQPTTRVLQEGTAAVWAVTDADVLAGG